jgi:hypothetical protein
MVNVRRLPVLVVVLLLAACTGPSATGTQSWTGLDLVLPEGWEVFERRDTLLSVADAPLGDEDGDVGDRTVAVQFTYEPSVSPQAWRDLVTGDGGDIEVDEQIQVDGVPATRLVFNWVTNGVPTREMVVVVPSRRLVMLFQPVPVSGQTDAPEIFLEHVDEFDAILTSIDFGAPPDSL